MQNIFNQMLLKSHLRETVCCIEIRLFMQNTLHLHGFSDTETMSPTIKSGRLWRSDQILRRVDTESERITNLLFWVKYPDQIVRKTHQFFQPRFYTKNSNVNISVSFSIPGSDVVKSGVLLPPRCRCCQTCKGLWRFLNNFKSVWL